MATSSRPKAPFPRICVGNLWAQDWSNVYPLVAPADADPGFSLTNILKAKEIGPLDMVRTGERFFTSLGFAPLPQTFWERSLFVKPRDRDVVCHASAWDIDAVDDLRIKMCIDQNAEDFSTIHHELGHNFYQRAYNTQPMLFRDSANDGFHEAIGDTIALSVTPEYLVRIGLLDQAPLPVERHRPAPRARARQGGVPAVRPAGRSVAMARVLGADSAGPLQQRVVGAEAAVPGHRAALAARRSSSSIPARSTTSPPARRTRAISSRSILQFQFHRALADVAGCRLPLIRCSIYESKEAGRATAGDARAGTVQAVARGAAAADRLHADGRDRDSRLLRAAAGVARLAAQGRSRGDGNGNDEWRTRTRRTRDVATDEPRMIESMRSPGAIRVGCCLPTTSPSFCGARTCARRGAAPGAAATGRSATARSFRAAPATATLIEFSHRLTSGLALLGVVALFRLDPPRAAAAAIRHGGRRRPR